MFIFGCFLGVASYGSSKPTCLRRRY
uniref:Uncharacterized protein n=1 Tax=Arundo donax TaxID=35708 RepID=A0A0A9T985_ARUDO